MFSTAHGVLKNTVGKLTLEGATRTQPSDPCRVLVRIRDPERVERWRQLLLIAPTEVEDSRLDGMQLCPVDQAELFSLWTAGWSVATDIGVKAGSYHACQLTQEVAVGVGMDLAKGRSQGKAASASLRVLPSKVKRRVSARPTALARSAHTGYCAKCFRHRSCVAGNGSAVCTVCMLL